MRVSSDSFSGGLREAHLPTDSPDGVRTLPVLSGSDDALQQQRSDEEGNHHGQNQR